MAASDNYFVEWKEHFVSKERGNRIVHYFFKDNVGESILAVVGTERSVRHMFYVVSEEFLKAYGAENSVHAGFRWRSRREVVNWLTSMLSKQHRQRDWLKSPSKDPISRVDAEQLVMPDHKGRLTRNLKGKQSDIVWSGVAWTCPKQLKHYPAFCRNGIAIMLQSFVYVMAEKESRHIAYLEDMYEDRKGQKKVKVRWFHHSQEVRGVVSLQNSHPEEVFITPYAQVISAECVDGPAVVLTRVHYEKFSTIFPDDLLARVHFCFREFKGNRLKPFKLSKLRGYYDQLIFSCFSADFFEGEESSSGDDIKVGNKRTRSCSEHQMMENEPLYQKLKYDVLGRRLNFQKHVEEHNSRAPVFKVNEKIEFLCQDSGIRGCWFRCTVLEVSRRQIKIQYDDVKDEDGCGNLKEWIPACRLARPDKLGIRYTRRSTIRPAAPCHQGDLAIKVGTPVDAWWSDGWWEGVVTGSSNSRNESYQVYSPGENLLLYVAKKNLRVSRDWVGDRWVDIEVNPDILPGISAAISIDAKCSVSSTMAAKCDSSPLTCHGVSTSFKLSIVKEETADVGGTEGNNDLINNEQQQVLKEEEKEDKDNNFDESDGKNKQDHQLTGDNNIIDESCGDGDDNDDDDDSEDDDNGARASSDGKLVEYETAGGSSEAGLMEVVG